MTPSRVGSSHRPRAANLRLTESLSCGQQTQSSILTGAKQMLTVEMGWGGDEGKNGPQGVKNVLQLQKPCLVCEETMIQERTWTGPGRSQHGEKLHHAHGEDRREDTPLFRPNTTLSDQVPGVLAWMFLLGDFHALLAPTFQVWRQPITPTQPGLSDGDIRPWRCLHAIWKTE